jgi:predicted phosphodiesterase
MNVLVIGDLHEPVCHPRYRHFCADMGRKYKCNTVVFIGDLVDWHAISFHVKEPHCPGPLDEYGQAKFCVNQWRNTFKHYRRKVAIIGNHDARVVRVAEANGIPRELLLDYKKMWHTPDWEWEHDAIIDGVYYTHGTGRSGKYPAANLRDDMLMSCCMGHIHHAAGINWTANPQTRVFGMDVGCGIDVKAWQFAYGQNFRKRPVLACGVVLNGTPQHIIMPMEKYPKKG